MFSTFAVALSALALAATPVTAAAAAAPAVLATSVAPATLWGPPAICHRIEIGDARSLPWGDGAFELDRGYDRAQLVPDTVALLDGSDDLLVHMETLRRATILITGLATPHDPGPKQLRAEASALVDALKARLGDLRVTAEHTHAGRDRVARALFDVGYLSAALSQARSGLGGADGPAQLVEAATELSGDAAAQLGVVLATCGHGTPDAHTWQHLDKLFDLVEDRGDPWSVRVAENATFIVGPFLGTGASDRDALAALAHERHQGV